VVPDSSERGITLDVAVNGSGFDQGSVVRFERQGVPAAKITTNSTTFVTPRKLIANITIAADADTGKYDVAVTTTSGRKGVGIELFMVTYQLDELGIIGGNWSRALSVNDRGEVVGESCTADCRGTAFYWTEAGGLEDLGTLPGYTRSAAHAINDRGQVFGVVTCQVADPECGGVPQERLVRWDRAGGSWIITPVDGCLLAHASDGFLINNNDQCVTNRWTGSAFMVLVQTLSGGVVVNEQPLPSVFPGRSNSGTAISGTPLVAGHASPPDSFPVPVIWYRSATGSWAFLRLEIPGADNSGRATDVSEPDFSGRVRVSGYAETLVSGTRSRGGEDVHPVRWTLEPDGTGGWRVASSELLPTERRSGAPGSWGTAVNVVGDVVGISNGFGTGERGRPARWPVGGGLEILPTLGGDDGRALDINSQGWIVGAVWDKGNNCDRAALWRMR
jgi:probable HAF family extracellular repeat protein